MTRIAAISQQIWDMKYRLKDDAGRPLDRTIADSWERVATALASVEHDPDHWRDRFVDIMQNFRFLPAGRILAGAGSGRQVTLWSEHHETAVFPCPPFRPRLPDAPVLTRTRRY